MLSSLIASTPAEGWILFWIEWASLIIEIIAVVIIVVVIITALSHYLMWGIFRPGQENNYQLLKIRLGRGLLLGLEILVAADIIRTVALEATLESVAVLGLLVLIRIILSWALFVEIEGRWPWRESREAQ
jgi:uncharacterized membrane protein